MKKTSFLLAILMLNFLFSSAQEEKKVVGTFYATVPILSYCHSYKVNDILVGKGADKIPEFELMTGLGLQIDINQLVMLLEVNLGGMSNKKTTLTHLPIRLAMGYQFKNVDLFLGGNLSFNKIYVYYYTKKESISLNDNSAITTNYVSMTNNQLMLGPVVSYNLDWCKFRVGYDFGIMPSVWKSSVVKIANSPKERLNMLYFQYIVNIAKF